MSDNKSILTGIKATGRLHLGNYFGTISPALKKAQNYEDAFYFIANYHSLNTVEDAKTLKKQTLNVAASWLASGLDPKKVHFYRQSDVPEIFELNTILNAATPKGWMNKAHAYKAAVDKNNESGKPVDSDINMGLYTYPVLMASDILIMNTNVVPVGKDQVQHVEIARDIAQKFNSQYSVEIFNLPEHQIEEDVSVLPGTDGRKMSKSYDNVIPLFATEKEWREAINKTKTSTEMTEESIKAAPLYQIFSVVASSEDANKLLSGLVQGEIQWKEAKEELLQRVVSRFSAQAQEYFRLIENPKEIEDVLDTGAREVKEKAQLLLGEVKRTIGV